MHSLQTSHFLAGRGKSLILIGMLVLFGVLLSACQSSTATPQATPTQGPAPVTATPTLLQATPTASAVPARTLVICVPDEPATLYVYGGSSRSMWSVLEAVYDGPFDTRNYAVQPVILQKIPSLVDGDALLQPVTVRAGDAVVDAQGNLTALKAGTTVLPAGCNQQDCAVSWDGSSELQMDQLVVNFKLLDGLQWSDGAPLTAEDSVFSYSLSADPATPVSRYLVDRTFSYQATDTTSVVWTGLPGFYEQRFGTFFWLPLPKHALGTKSATELLQDPAATRSPLGWGPYVIGEWVAGDHISLDKNPNYFRAADGLPAFDHLVYRFVGPTGDGDLAALMTGECDVVDQNTDFYGMFPGLLERETAGKLKTYVGQGPEWEHLDFGIRPASYEDGIQPEAGDRPDLFGDARTRQALAYCIDREGIANELLYRRSAVPTTFLPAGHPLVAPGLPTYAYDPSAGMKLLDEVGWKDTDGDPKTPRLASGVPNVPDGTPLTFNYLTTEAALRKQVAERMAQSLRGCGVQANLSFQSPGDLFGPGPDGKVFGRQFDAVQFSWEASARPNCLLYTSGQIPSAENRWVGANVSGYSNPEYDRACAEDMQTRVSDPQGAAAAQQVQQIFANDLPVIPLYSYLKIAISRPDLCGLAMDVTTRSIFWNLETLNYGSDCPSP